MADKRPWHSIGARERLRAVSSDPTDLNRPEIQLLRKKTPFLWLNPGLSLMENCRDKLEPGPTEFGEAEARWERFAPLLSALFPELKAASGLIESELMPAPNLAAWFKRREGLEIKGPLFAKGDHALPVAGSVKARGGVYAVLHFAEKTAIAQGLLSSIEDDYGKLAGAEARECFRGYELAVGSTGNLGLSIGLMGRALGFKVSVHMSREAKEWKKKRLRELGVRVVEHQTDYTGACRAVREAAAQDPKMHFIDDENSVELFLGYAAAAGRLKRQLEAAGYPAGPDNPLFLYLPCGVGGAPGGLTFGARLVFGDHVHCFFAEPVEAPCQLLGLATGLHEKVSIYDIGLELKTEADGLAVSRASSLVGRLMEPLLSGCFTIEDEALYRYLAAAYKTEGLEIEPSAAAGFSGPGMLLNTSAGREYLRRHGLDDRPGRIVHVLWATGGVFVPPEEHLANRQRGSVGL